MKLNVMYFSMILNFVTSIAITEANDLVSDGDSRVTVYDSGVGSGLIQVMGKPAKLLWDSMTEVKEVTKTGPFIVKVNGSQIDSDLYEKVGKDFECVSTISFDKDNRVILNSKGELVRDFQCNFTLEKPKSGQLGAPR